MKRIACVLLLAAFGGGCETVVFEQAPVAAQACDPALVGNWLSKGDKPGTDGEVELRISADCTLLFVEHGPTWPALSDWMTPGLSALGAFTMTAA